MRTKFRDCFILLALLAGVHQAAAQLPVITSFSQNGVLVCSGLQTGTVATVQWASSLSGPWQSNWASLASVAVSNNGTITVSVPMFYRVLGRTNSADGMALIPAGSFMIGDTLDGEWDAIPTNVYVSAFYMDTNLVSYSQWQGVYSYATNHGYSLSAGSGQAANHPVQTVDWHDCVKWSNARSQQAAMTPVYYTDAGFTQVFTNGDYGTALFANWAANGYRLPTEAEWEKAARGGLTGQRFPWGNTISESQANYYADPDDFAYDLGPYTGYNTNFTAGEEPYTSPVGYFAPNRYGLYDMAGNVDEWCWDGWAGPPYPVGSAYLGGTDPRGPLVSLGYRVFRGGYWGVVASVARCAQRAQLYPYNAINDLGFRCVRGL